VYVRFLRDISLKFTLYLWAIVLKNRNKSNKRKTFLLNKFVGLIKSKWVAKKSQIKNEDVSSASDNSQEKAKARAALYEFVKYKELLSKGSITREEFKSKTGELFKDYVKTK
jgi:hypothetical protein